MIADAYNVAIDADGNPALRCGSVPPGWSLYGFIDNTGAGGDAAAIFMNSSTSPPSLFIAGRGTDTLNDVMPDVAVGLGRIPASRIADAERILQNLHRDFPECDICAGGHSLDAEVWARVSENQEKNHGIHLSVLALDAPNTFRGSAYDRSVLEIGAQYDWVGHYGAGYSNSVTLDTAVRGGMLHQFGKHGTHSVVQLERQGVDRNPVLADSQLGQNVDGAGVVACGNVSEIHLAGLGPGRGSSNEDVVAPPNAGAASTKMTA